MREEIQDFYMDLMKRGVFKNKLELVCFANEINDDIMPYIYASDFNDGIDIENGAITTTMSLGNKVYRFVVASIDKMSEDVEYFEKVYDSIVKLEMNNCQLCVMDDIKMMVEETFGVSVKEFKDCVSETFGKNFVNKITKEDAEWIIEFIEFSQNLEEIFTFNEDDILCFYKDMNDSAVKSVMEKIKDEKFCSMLRDKHKYIHEQGYEDENSIETLLTTPSYIENNFSGLCKIYRLLKTYGMDKIENLVIYDSNEYKVSHLEEDLKERINSEFTCKLTAVMKQFDDISEMQLIQISMNDSYMNNILTAEEPISVLRNANGATGFVLGSTEKMKTDSKYFEKYMELVKSIGLDKNYDIYECGGRTLNESNFEEDLKERINEEDAMLLTGTIKLGDFLSEKHIVQFSSDQRFVERLKVEKAPLRLWNGNGGFILGITERLKNEPEYLDKYVKMTKEVGLDKNYDIYTLGGAIIKPEEKMSEDKELIAKNNEEVAAKMVEEMAKPKETFETISNYTTTGFMRF